MYVIFPYKDKPKSLSNVNISIYLCNPLLGLNWTIFAAKEIVSLLDSYLISLCRS